MTTLDREAFLGGYLAEVEEHLGAIVRHLGTMGGGEARQPRAVREIFRSLHTIKGLSAMVGVEPIVEIAHELETIARTADRRGGLVPAGGADLLAEGVRAIEQRLRQVARREPVSAAPAALLEALGGGAHADAAPAAATPAIQLDDPDLTASEREQIAQAVRAGRACTRIDVVSTPDRVAAGHTITAVRERLGAIGEIVRVIPRALPRGPDAPGGLGFSIYLVHDGAAAALTAAAGVDERAAIVIAAAATTPILAPAPALADPDDLAFAAADGRADAFDEGDATGGRVVRVEVSRLDDALERLSAVLVTRFRLGRAVAELRAAGADVRRLEQIMVESSRQLRDLRAAIMRVRMVSVAELLERVPLMLRGLSRTTGKRMTLTIEAGQAEVDKAVGEQLFPAIVHLIRNAVDHGLEPPAERAARGKPVEGQIRVSCHGRGNGQLELAISDDGRGVDVTAVARRAGRPAPRDDDELLELLATPGLSTLREATTTSGRGLGVDIVHRIVRGLGGELRMSTTEGRGTQFTMRVPLSITIVDAFSFEASGHVFVAPVSAIDQIVEIDPTRLTRTPPRPGGGLEISLLDLRGAAVPLVRLDQAFGLAPHARAADGLPEKAIVVRQGAGSYAFLVDRMLGHQEVVIRPIIDEFVRVPGVTGSTDLGDGRPVLVLDLLALTDVMGGGRTARGALR